ncbi:MAG: efflux RND transporter periplasmic adaptor subunit, partial [Muribaculaceae bacterium]|nr:efflux RND transporter periplasmic adaptor subunit [Muribaculaceae bacterium]
VSTGSSDLDHTYPTTIKGKTDVEIRPLVSGFVTKVNVEEGQHVRKGQTLFTLDQVQYQAAVSQAEAAVNSAKIAVDNARLQADNQRQLFEKNIISEYTYTVAKNQLATAQAQLANAQAALTTARKNLSYTVVTAPSDGVIGSIPNKEGTLASPSMVTPLTTVSDNSEVYAYFSLNEKDMLELTDGGSRSLASAIAAMPAVRLQLADGTIYGTEGKVSTISGIVDQSTGSSNVRARFANPSGVLRSGSTGSVLIPSHQENVILIPQKATYEVQDKRFVYALNDSNKTMPVAITVAPLDNGKEYVVTSGLEPGQRIVVEGVGSKINQANILVKPKAAAAAATQTEENAK